MPHVLPIAILHDSEPGPNPAHPLLVRLGDYAFAIYLWATPVACVLGITFVHSDFLLQVEGNGTDPIDDTRRIGIEHNLNMPGFGAWLLLVHVWAVAYTDLFERSVFDGDAGCIGAVMRRNRVHVPSAGKQV